MLWLNGSLYGLRIYYAIIFQEIPPVAKESFGVFLDGNYDIKIRIEMHIIPEYWNLAIKKLGCPQLGTADDAILLTTVSRNGSTTGFFCE